jgi:D-alanine-D-alanine ligase
MDKDLAKRLLRDAGVRTPDWVYVDPNLPESRETILSKIGLPCVIKPTSCGSSVGVTIVENENELDAALAAAAPWGDRVLAEKKINGRELTVGILDGKTLPIVEIIPNEGFYDYKNKYQGNTREVCPAEISENAAEKAADATLCGFEALRLRGYARFDYILDETGEVWCLEANTLPGMTPLSLLPMAAKAAGISYEELCEKIDAECANNRIETDDGDVQISLARGFARYDCDKDMQLVDVFNRADYEMYKQKRKMKSEQNSKRFY